MPNRLSRSQLSLFDPLDKVVRDLLFDAGLLLVTPLEYEGDPLITAAVARVLTKDRRTPVAATLRLTVPDDLDVPILPSSDDQRRIAGRLVTVLCDALFDVIHATDPELKGDGKALHQARAQLLDLDAANRTVEVKGLLDELAERGQAATAAQRDRMLDYVLLKMERAEFEASMPTTSHGLAPSARSVD